jgi:RimJ/RimL family protein N-acetyltransferase
MFPRKLINENDTREILEHFLRLDTHDRYMRFGFHANDEAIENYLRKGAFSNYGIDNMWFISTDENGAVIGTVHVAIDGKIAELGFTVSKDVRGRGLGQDLFMRGATWAMMKGVDEIYTQCLSENEVMQHIAKKNGMTVVTISRGEKEATIHTTKGIVESYFQDRAFDNIALVDASISNQHKVFKALIGVK